jgi:hypothetical protein
MGISSAQNFITYIAQLHDHYTSKTDVPELLHAESEETCEDNQESMETLKEDPRYKQTVEYNHSSTMADWYTRTNPSSPITDVYVPGNTPGQRVIEGSVWIQRAVESEAIQRSALCHLTAMKKEINSVIPIIIGRYFIYLPFANFFIPPLLNIISPKSYLDNFVFENVYLKSTETERAEIERLMQEACKVINVQALDEDQLIYRIQGIVAVIYPAIKGVVLMGLVYATLKIFEEVLKQISNCFFKTIVPPCNALIDQHASIQVSQNYHLIFNKMVAINRYMMTMPPTSLEFAKKHCISYGINKVIFLSARVSFLLYKGLRACFYVVFPQRYIWLLASRPIYRTGLVVYKILSGAEHQTIRSIKKKFENQPEVCEQGLKAHALFMHLMKKGSPTDAMILDGWLPLPY